MSRNVMQRWAGFGISPSVCLIFLFYKLIVLLDTKCFSGIEDAINEAKVFFDYEEDEMTHKRRL